MICSTLNVSFGEKSKNGLEKVGTLYKKLKIFNAALSAGVLVNLFFKNGVIGSSYAISNYDFKLFSEAMQSSPGIIRSGIQQIAWDLSQDNSISYNEREFWKCIINAA